MTVPLKGKAHSAYRWLPRLILVIIGLSILAGVLTLQHIKDRLLASSGESLALAATSTADKLDLLLTERYGDFQLIGNTALFQTRDVKAIAAHLHQLQNAYPVYLWLGMADRHGRIVAATDAVAVGMDYSNSTWFQGARDKQGPYAEDAAPSREADEFAVTFSTSVLTTSGDFEGVVVGQIGLHVLEDSVARVTMGLQAQLGTQHNIEWQILNQAGDVIADSVLRQEGAINLSQLGVPSARLVQSGPPGFVEERHLRRDIEVLSGYARTKGSIEFPGLGWAVLVRLDREDILLPIHRILWFFIGGMSSVLLPMVGLLMWSTRRLELEWKTAASRNEALRGLVEAARKLTSEQELTTLLQRLVDTSRELTGASYSAMAVFDPSGMRLTQFVTSGMDEATKHAIKHLPSGKGLLGHLATADGVLRLTDLSQHPASSGVPPHHPPMDSFLGTSIRVQDKLFGRLYLTNKRHAGPGKADFTDLDEHIISALATQTGVAIKTASLLEELRNAEEQARLLLESTGEGICGVDLSGRCTFINQAAATMLGYLREDLLGENLHQLVHHRYPDGLLYPVEQCPIFHACQTGQGCRVEDEHLVRKDGSMFPVEMLAHPIFNKDRVTGAVITFQDISARKQAQEALTRAAQDLEWKNWELALARDHALASARLKSEFLATMSHEIRTPLNGIIGMGELLLDTALTKEQHEYVQTLQSSGESLVYIVNDILDFSKIEAGKLDLEVIDFHLRSTIESVLNLLGERAHKKGLELIGLVFATVPSDVRGDPYRIRQVLTNLLGNAIKFTEHGEVLLQVALAQEFAEHIVVRFDVSDTGIGISPEGQTRLFQSFSQADGSTTRKYGGTGLGLAICKRLVEMMDGEIGVDSALGKGTRFWFTMRLGKQPASVKPPDEPLVELRGIRVCLVDDNATNRTLLQHHTAAWEMRGTSVEDGRLALKLLQDEAACGDPFQVAIIDMQMPGMDGFALARAIRADATLNALRLVLLTSLGHRGDAQAAQSAGIAAYLTKPVHQSELYECLKLVMRSQPGLDHSLVPNSTPLITIHHITERAHCVGPRILVAEDNSINQLVIVRLLDKLGYRADVAGTGREVLTALADQAVYDLILMDCQMPDIDGYAATGHIRAREDATRHIPIIALTANAMKEDRDKCLQAGMDDFLSKPITFDTLKAMLDRWLPSNPHAHSRK